MRKLLLFICAVLILSGCRTINVEKEHRAEIEHGKVDKDEKAEPTLEELDAEQRKLEDARDAELAEIQRRQNEIEKYKKTSSEVEAEYRQKLADLEARREKELKRKTDAVLDARFLEQKAELESKLADLAKEKAALPDYAEYNQLRENVASEYNGKIQDIKMRKERNIKTDYAVERAMLEVEPQVVYVEKPVYIPEGGKPAASKGPIDTTYDKVASGTAKPSDYSHAAVVYDFHSNWVYEVYAEPLRTCDIILEANETVVESPFIADSERWMLGAGVSYEGSNVIQHIYVKPKVADISASMIVNTDRRVYHILLRSYASVYMPIVKWRYVLNNFPYNLVKAKKIDEGKSGVSGDMEYVDPRYLSFDYKITYSLFSKPKWLPRMVYDDGKKTYIVFSNITLMTELPGIFENRKDVINYRVSGDLIIIDKLIEKITVKLNKDKVIIEKK